MKTNGVVGAALALSIGLSAAWLPAQDFQTRSLTAEELARSATYSSPVEPTSVFASGDLQPVSASAAVEESPAAELVQPGSAALATPAAYEIVDTETTAFESFVEGCCDCCCVGCYDPHWYAGTEFSFLAVNNRTGGRITLSHTDTTAPGVASVSFRDGGGIVDFAYAPRLWIGRQWTENWGVRATYFSLAANEIRPPHNAPNFTPTGTNFATFVNTATTSQSAIDVDLVRSFNPSDAWKLDVLVGARYAKLAVDAELFSFGVFTSGNHVNLYLSNGCYFEGVGPSVAFQSRHRLHDSNLFFFVNGRGSYCYGLSDSYGRASGSIASSPNAPLVGSATVTRANADDSYLGILETQIGLQYEFQLADLPIQAFVRTSVDWQYWRIDGPPTGGAGFGGTIGELSTNSFSAAGLGSSNLVGLSFATGFTW